MFNVSLATSFTDCYHQGGDTGFTEPGPINLKKVFTHDPSGSLMILCEHLVPLLYAFVCGFFKCCFSLKMYYLNELWHIGCFQFRPAPRNTMTIKHSIPFVTIGALKPLFTLDKQLTRILLYDAL